MKSIKNIEFKSSLLAILGILLSKMCCILPLLGAALGGSLFFEGVKVVAPFMLLGSILIVSYSWYRFIKPQNCTCVQQRTQKRNTLLVSSALLVVLFFFQIILPVLQPTNSHINISTANIPTCHTSN